MDPRSQHLLLVAVGPAIAGVRMLVDEAIRGGPPGDAAVRGRDRRTRSTRRRLLPDEVEYVVATDDGSLGHHGTVTDLVADYEAWADQAFACGPRRRSPHSPGSPRGGASASASRSSGASAGPARPTPPGSPAARRKAFLQVSMEQEIGCAVGACLGCVVMAASGTPQRVCREGPVFASDEIAWEAA